MSKKRKTFITRGGSVSRDKEMRERYEVSGPQCLRCKGTIIQDIVSPNLSSCFQCGRPYKLTEKGELVLRYGQ